MRVRPRAASALTSGLTLLTALTPVLPVIAESAVLEAGALGVPLGRLGGAGGGSLAGAVALRRGSGVLDSEKTVSVIVWLCRSHCP